MSWFRENRLLGTFLVGFGVALLAALWFLWSAHSSYDEARTRFETDAAELSRLQRLTPFPSAENLRKIKAHAQDYGTAVTKLKEDLATRVVPVVPIAPSEFQS